MNTLLNSLKDICNHHMLDTKIVIMNSYEDGNQLVEMAAREGFQLLNLKIETLIGLVQYKSSNYLYKNNKKLIDSTLTRIIITKILRELKSNNQLKYFSNIEITPGIVKVICNAVSNLRMAGYKSSTLKKEYFINSAKAEDIINIMKNYEIELEDNNLVDEQDIFNISLNNVKTNQKAVYIVSDTLKPTQAEYCFLKNLSQNPFYILTTREIDKDKITPNHISNYFKDLKYYNELSKTNSIFSYFYSPENIPNDVQNIDIHLIQAYGEYNETKALLCNIKVNNLNFDETSIYYTIQEPYTQYLFDLSQKYDIPITFGDGINIKNTNPGKLFFSLLEWINSNYSFSTFYSILVNGYIKTDNDSITNYSIARYLRKLNIGWGKERYFKCISEDIENNKDHYKEYNKLDNYNWIKTFIQELFERFPKLVDDSVHRTDELVMAIAEVVEKYSNIISDTDAEAKSKILEQLKILVEYHKEELEINMIIKELADYIGGIRVAISGPQPSHIHAANYRKGVWNTRQNTFIVGMDADKFPGQIIEDPILLDIEREALGNGLNLNKNKILDNKFLMVQLLKSLWGKVYISYSSYNTIDNKVLSPCSLLLQIYRLKTKDSTKDYGSLIKSFDHCHGFIPKEESHIIDNTDWWLHKNTLGIKNKDKLFNLQYKNIRQGLTAMEKRLNNDFTAFDGKVQVDGNIVDPRINKDIVVSVSRLEQIAICPYGYFLKYILGVSPPEDLEYDPSNWLDAMTRGSLLHRIYELFYKEIKSKGEKLSLNKHGALIYSIANKVIDEQKEVLPPPNEMIYEYERNEILTSCKVFLINECDNFRDCEPTYFELVFGIKGEYHEDFGEIEPIELQLPKGESVRIRGRIDRIDKINDNTFNILDYKTGGTFGFKHRQYFEKARKLQHAVYAKVFEKILKDYMNLDNAIVDKAGYLFPTLKGEGELYLRGPNSGLRKRDEVLDLMEKLLDVVSNGSFIMTNEGNDCKYCDYIEICCWHIYSETIQSLREGYNDEGLVLLKEIDKYE